MTTQKHEFSSEVILIGIDGENLGQMSAGKARAIAKEQELDIVEINKQNGLSVCKIMDRGKWLYEQKKKKKAQHAHSAHAHMKEIKFGMRIETHDFETKIDHIKRLLEKGHHVRIYVEMMGREKAHPENARLKMDLILASLNGMIKADVSKQVGSSIVTTITAAGKTSQKHESHTL